MTLDSIFQTVDTRLTRIEEVRKTMQNLSSLNLTRVVKTYPITWKMRDFLTEVFGERISLSAVYYRAAQEELRRREDQEHHTLY